MGEATGKSLTDTAASRGQLYTRRYTQYVLGVLTVVYVFNFIDRQILAILAPAIQSELGLSDTQIGALSGLAFGIFYATLGIPIARLADRYSRVNIISICLTIWSAMTAISGIVGNYWQLLAARIGVGIGEAGGSPPSHSLIADYFPVSERATALGIYSLGIPVGILFGNLAGGWISEYFGWRHAFFLVGLPGVLLAILLKTTIKEPPRGHSEGRTHKGQPIPFRNVLRTMWRFRSFQQMSLGAATQSFVGYGIVAFMPLFLVRVHGMSPGEVGTALGLIIGIVGGIGTFMGGYLTDRLGPRDVRWYMWLPGTVFLLAVPASLGVYFVDSIWLALGLFIVPALTVMYTGPTFGMTQSLAPVAMRASASALLLFIINIIGLTLGPTMVGVLSDWLQQIFELDATESLRWALATCALVYLVSFANYLVAGKHLGADLAETRRMSVGGLSE